MSPKKILSSRICEVVLETTWRSFADSANQVVGLIKKFDIYNTIKVRKFRVAGNIGRKSHCIWYYEIKFPRNSNCKHIKVEIDLIWLGTNSERIRGRLKGLKIKGRSKNKWLHAQSWMKLKFFRSITGVCSQRAIRKLCKQLDTISQRKLMYKTLLHFTLILKTFYLRVLICIYFFRFFFSMKEKNININVCIVWNYIL